MLFYIFGYFCALPRLMTLLFYTSLQKRTDLHITNLTARLPKAAFFIALYYYTALKKKSGLRQKIHQKYLEVFMKCFLIKIA